MEYIWKTLIITIILFIFVIGGIVAGDKIRKNENKTTSYKQIKCNI